MKALVVPADDQLEIRDIAPPVPGPYDALVRIEVCGICNSTDLKAIHRQMSWVAPYPFVLGHESVGTVEKVGAKVRKFRIGDRVTRPLAFWPGSRRDLNVAIGGFAEYGIVRDAAAMAADGDRSLLDDYNAQRQLVVPANLPALTAALAISLSETASVLASLPNLHGKKVVVTGTGIAGLSLTLWVTLAGGFVITLGRRSERLEAAKRLGAAVTIDTRANNYLSQIEAAAGGLVDGVIEAIGDVNLAAEALRVLKPAGFACAYGAPSTGNAYGPRWTGAAVEEHQSFAWVADLIGRGWVKPEWFVSHTWKLAAAAEAFAQVKRGEVLKGFVEIP